MFSQALRYPYFHVGQSLGTPLKYSEQHKTPAKVSEVNTEPKPPSLYKTESQTCSQSLYQPLHQIQLPHEPNVTRPSMLTEGQQEPLSLVKNRQPMSWQTVSIAQVQIHANQNVIFSGFNFFFILFLLLVYSFKSLDEQLPPEPRTASPE